MAQPPIQFDRASGALEGANLWERTAALALATGSKISSHFSHMGYIACANLLRKTLPERNIAIRLNDDAVFEFPYGDGYWSKLLNRSYHYEDELELLFQDSADVDYTLLDCGANYGYWSVLVSSAAVRLAQGDCDRAVGAEFSEARQQRQDQRQPFRADEVRDRRGAGHRAAVRHQARGVQHRRRASDDGEEVPVIALDNLVDDGKVSRRRQIPDQARRRGRRDRGDEGRRAAVAGRQRDPVRGAWQRSRRTPCRATSSSRRR